MKTNLLLDQKIQAVEINTLVISESSKRTFQYEVKNKSLSQNWPIKFRVPGIYSPLVVYKKR